MYKTLVCNNYTTRRRQMLASAALNRRRRLQRRRNRRFRFWCLPHYQIHIFFKTFVEKTKIFEPRAVYTCCLCRIAKIQFLPVFQIWLTLRQKKNKNCFFKAIRQDMTCFEAGHRLLWSLGPSDIVMSGRDKRVALVASMRWQILCPM